LDFRERDTGDKRPTLKRKSKALEKRRDPHAPREREKEEKFLRLRDKMAHLRNEEFRSGRHETDKHGPRKDEAQDICRRKSAARKKWDSEEEKDADRYLRI